MSVMKILTPHTRVNALEFFYELPYRAFPWRDDAFGDLDDDCADDCDHDRDDC